MATGTDTSIEKLRDLIKGIKIAMLTTQEDDGTLRSRPMFTQETEFDGDLWFFTAESSPKVDEIQQQRQVNVSYISKDTYLSVSGKAQLVRDRQKIEELWNPVYKAWFPNGKDDPDLALLKVHVEQAEYWQSPPGAVVKLAGFAKALVTGERYEGGENRKLDLKD
ncbi:MAG: pyridoxamine 5'-phosphate oxidase family protein [Anaerolineae bacterium]|nr:pyridoxamine 5'-phosphate oxidase family protein [Anaerolineae bacterium]